MAAGSTDRQLTGSSVSISEDTDLRMRDRTEDMILAPSEFLRVAGGMHLAFNPHASPTTKQTSRSAKDHSS